MSRPATQEFGHHSATLGSCMPILVVGNGQSREQVDLNQISNIVGCNALIRDVPVDHLVCCDRRMVEEAIEHPNAKNTIIYVRPDWFEHFRKIKKDRRILKVPELPYQTSRSKIDNPIHWGSGAYAVLLAATLDDEVTLLGFDLYSINDKVNNIYKGTLNYCLKESKPVDHSYWEYQIGKVFESFPDTKFKILNNKDWILPKKWKYPNVEFEVLATKNLTFA